MTAVRLEGLTKRFGAVAAVDAVDLSIESGEFVVLVGPSGSGKTTCLRMIAGLEAVTSGSIFIGDRDVATVHAKDRDVAMVFQSYALYPHMSVTDNMGFALKLKKVPRDEIDRRVLGAIAEKFDGGPVGLETIAASVGEESDTIMDVYEPFLMQLGFLSRTPRGRIATRRGYEHLGLAYPDRLADNQAALWPAEPS